MTDAKAYADFLDVVIADGIADAERKDPSPSGRGARDGALRGFGECRGLSHDRLLALRDAAQAKAVSAAASRQADRRFWRARADAIEWALGVMSAASFAQGEAFVFPPSAAAAHRAFAMLGIHG